MTQSVRQKLRRESPSGSRHKPVSGLALLLWMMLIIPSPVGAGPREREDRTSSISRPTYTLWLFEVEQELRILSESNAPPFEVAERLRHLRSSSTLARPPETNSPHLTRWLEREIEALLPSASDDIEQRRSKLLEVANRITRLRAMLNEEPLAPRREDEGVEEVAGQARLQSILKRTQVLPPQAEEPGSLQQSWATIQAWWDELLENLGREPNDRPAQAEVERPERVTAKSLLFSGVLILLLGLSLFIGGWHLRAILRDRKQVSTTPGPSPARAQETVGELLDQGMGEQALLRQATTLASQEDYRSAIRLLYLATLTHLTERGLLALRPTWSNRDCVQALRNEEQLLPLVGRLTTRYEESWYGAQASTRPAYEGFRSGYEEVLIATTHRLAKGEQRSESKP